MDTYGTVDGFRTYHTARLRDVSSFENAAIEGAKLIASESVDARFRAAFPGTKVGQRLQVREWPRQNATDRDGWYIQSATVPTEIENATYELTLRELQAPGSLSVDFTPNKYIRARVDGAVDVTYAQFNSAADVQTSFAIVGEILAPILNVNGSSSGLSGAATRA